MPRAQFSLKNLLRFMAVVAAFCGGIATGRFIEASHNRYKGMATDWGGYPPIPPDEEPTPLTGVGVDSPRPGCHATN